MTDPERRPARWYVLVGGDQTGPFDLVDLRDRVVTGSIGPETWVWADGMPEWRQALRVPALVPPPSLGVEGWPAPRPDDVVVGPQDLPQ